MQYRIKEVVDNNKSYFYPQWKKWLFWRKFIWWGGEDGTTPYAVVCDSASKALAHIQRENNKRRPEPRKIVYHKVELT